MPRWRRITQSRQPIGDGAFRPVQTSQKDAGCFAYPVGDYRALLQLHRRAADQAAPANVEAAALVVERWQHLLTDPPEFELGDAFLDVGDQDAIGSFETSLH
jgi:hypothetical protein